MERAGMPYPVEDREPSELEATRTSTFATECVCEALSALPALTEAAVSIGRCATGDTGDFGWITQSAESWLARLRARYARTVRPDPIDESPGDAPATDRARVSASAGVRR